MAATNGVDDSAWQFRRRFRVLNLDRADDAEALRQALLEMPGILEVGVDPERGVLMLRYSAVETGYDAVVARLRDLGLPPRQTWWRPLHAAWCRYTEDNARVNARAPASPCCNKPPK